MPANHFATTHWSVVKRAADTDSRDGAEALEAVCRDYWYPVYAEIRRRGHGEMDSKDLTQEFFACLLRRGSLAEATPAKGRFRSYLLGALDFFLVDAWCRERAAKRGGGRVPISFDAMEAEDRFRNEPATTETPARAFDRRWALSLLECGLRRLEAEQVAVGNAATFMLLRSCLAFDTESGDYHRVAVELGMKSGAVAVAVHRLRRRYREIVREEVRRTVTGTRETETELRLLFESW